MRRKKTSRNGQVQNVAPKKVPLNIQQLFETVTNQVLSREIITELNERATEYHKWISDEQTKAEQILIDCEHMLSQTKLWFDDFLHLFKMTNENGRNDENEECRTIDSLTEKKIQFRSNNSSRGRKINPSTAKNDHKKAPFLPPVATKDVKNFRVKRTANAICRKRKILEEIVEKTRKFRENSESRVKERKKQIEKENEERRNQALTKIEQQTLNVAKNRERECREFSSTPIAKRTRSAYNSTPVAKRLHTKAVVFPELNDTQKVTSKQRNGEIAPINVIQRQSGRVKRMKKQAEKKATIPSKAFYGSTMNQPVSPVEINSDQIASAKCNFKAAISKQSNMEAVFSPEFDCNSSEMTDSPEVTALSYSDEHMKQNCTDVELKNVLESCRTSEPFTAKDFSRLKQDEANINEVGNLSSTSLMSINTASIFEITAPTDKSFDIIKHSTPIIHRSEAHKVNSDYMIHKGGTKRSTYLTGDLKFEQETTVDNLHVMLMDVGSSSSKSTSTYASESDVVKKRAKVSNTRFPSRRTLDELEKQEFDSLHQSTDAKEKIEEDVTEYGISDLLSDARTESMEQPRKKIPSWATAENIRQSLEKQQTWSVIDINALFGKIHPPEMQKMLGDLAKLRPARRSSSAMWESPIWNPRVGYSAYHPTIEETNQQVYNVRRSQRTKSSVSYFPYL